MCCDKTTNNIAITKESTESSQPSQSKKSLTPVPILQPEPEPTPQTAGSNFAVNGENGKIHIVGACPATGSGDSAMEQPVYFNAYEETEAYSIQNHTSQKKRQCGNCW